MKKTLIFVSVILILALSACTGAQGMNQANQRMVSVSGKGQVYLIPDVVYVMIGVHSESESVTEALNKNNADATSITKVLQEMGVDVKDIQTTAFNVYPQQQYGANGDITGTKYVVENTVYVTVRDLDKLGEMLDATVRSGANSINSITFDVEDKSEALAQARTLAVQDASAQAKELATAAGVTLGNLISMSAYSSGIPLPAYESKVGGGQIMAMDSRVPVSAGQLILVVDANLSYEIK